MVAGAHRQRCTNGDNGNHLFFDYIHHASRDQIPDGQHQQYDAAGNGKGTDRYTDSRKNELAKNRNASPTIAAVIVATIYQAMPLFYRHALAE